MALLGWRTTKTRRGGERLIWVHVAPRKDMRRHVTRHGVLKCWCEPDIERGRGYTMVSHHSADGRELIELHGVN